jgi:predicted phage tail protein
MAEIRARLILDDDFSAQIEKSIEGTDLFAKSIIKAKTQMKDLSAQRFEATIKSKDEATKKVTEVKRAMESIKKDIAITIAAKDVTSESINRIKGHLELLGAKTFQPVIKAKDEVSGVLNIITDKLFSLKTMAAGVVLGGVGKGLCDFTLGKGV